MLARRLFGDAGDGSAAAVEHLVAGAGAADLAFVTSAAIAAWVAIAGPFRLAWGTLVIFSAGDSWRALLVAAISAAIRVALRSREPLAIVSRFRDLTSISLRWLFARRHAQTTFYALLVIFCVGLTLGPPLGLWPLVYWLPGFNFIRAASRFMLLAMLGLSVMAGAGFEWAAARLTASAQLAAAALVAALLVAEFAVPLEVVPCGWSSRRLTNGWPGNRCRSPSPRFPCPTSHGLVSSRSARRSSCCTRWRTGRRRCTAGAGSCHPATSGCSLHERLPDEDSLRGWRNSASATWSCTRSVSDRRRPMSSAGWQPSPAVSNCAIRTRPRASTRSTAAGEFDSPSPFVYRPSI